MKLNDEQIAHWRNVFALMGLPMAQYIPAKTIEILRDRMQENLDKRDISTWIVTVRFVNDTRLWCEIPSEPKRPFASLYTIKDKCCRLLLEHPEINSFLLTDANCAEDVFLINRDSMNM